MFRFVQPDSDVIPKSPSGKFYALEDPITRENATLFNNPAFWTRGLLIGNLVLLLWLLFSENRAWSLDALPKGGPVHSCFMLLALDDPHSCVAILSPPIEGFQAAQPNPS